MRRPETTAIRYVGFTKRPLEIRLQAHLGKPLNDPMQRWFNRLKRDGMRPEMVTLATIEGNYKAKEVESAWIASMAVVFGPLLFNKFGRGDTIFRRELVNIARRSKRLAQLRRIRTRNVIQKCRRNGKPYPKYPPAPKMYKADGECGSIAFWAERIGISRQRVHQRIEKCRKKKVSIKYALTTPAGETMPCFK